MKTTVSAPPVRAPRSRGIPMPLWLQGAVEFLVAALASFVAVFVLIGAISLTNGFNKEQNVASVAKLSGNIWLLMHGVPLNLNIPVNGMFDAIAGTVSLTPLGLTLLPLYLTFRAGRRLAQASYEGQFWQPILAGLLVYVAITAAVSYVADTPRVGTLIGFSMLMPFGVALLGAILGGYYESRSLARMIGVNAATVVSRFSQYSRWAGSYVWSVVRAAGVGVIAFIAGGALLAAGALFYNWNDVVSIYQSLHAGAVGDTALTLLQFGFVPNLVVFAMAWSTGAGFSLGAGTAVDLTRTDVGVLPALPMLGALPQPVEPWSFIACAIPLLAGAIAGWWFFREGEDHFDEWVSLKIRFRPVSWLISVVFLAVLIGALGGLVSVALGQFSRGSLGLGRLTAIGPDPLEFGLYAAALLALGVILGRALAPLIEPDNSRELERFAGQTRADRKATKKAQRQKARTLRAQQKKSGAKDATALDRPVIDGEVVSGGSVSASSEALRRLFADEQQETEKTASFIAAPADRAEPETPVQQGSSQSTEDSEQTVGALNSSEGQADATETVFDVQQDTLDTSNTGLESVEPVEETPKKRAVIRRPKAKRKKTGVVDEN